MGRAAVKVIATMFVWTYRLSIMSAVTKFNAARTIIAREQERDENKAQKLKKTRRFGMFPRRRRLKIVNVNLWKTTGWSIEIDYDARVWTEHRIWKLTNSRDGSIITVCRVVCFAIRPCYGRKPVTGFTRKSRSVHHWVFRRNRSVRQANESIFFASLFYHHHRTGHPSPTTSLHFARIVH